MEPKEKFHELTQKVWDVTVVPSSKDYVNKIIVEWLEEKSIELTQSLHSLYPNFLAKKFAEILGLTEEAKEPTIQHNYTYEDSVVGGYISDAKEKPVERKEWCEHMDYDCGRSKWPITTNKEWKFCPICAAPRPEPEKPRKLAEILYEAGCDRNWKDRTGFSDEFYTKVATAAITAVLEVWERWEDKGIFGPETKPTFPDYLKKELLGEDK